MAANDSKFIHYRGHDWINTKTGAKWFGIQARIHGERKWMHCARDKKACIYETEAERDAVMADCVKKQKEQARGR